MAFKMNGWNAGMGTGSANSMYKKDVVKSTGKKEKSVVKPTTDTKTVKSVYKKDEPKMSNEDWQKGKDSAAAHGDDLNSLVAQRKNLKKGSPEYNVVQNKINQALGSKKRHTEGAHRSSETDNSSKVVYKDKEEGTKDKIKTKDTSYGSKEKIVTKGPEGTKKTVVKKDHDGNIIGERGYDTTKNNENNKDEKNKDEKNKKGKSSDMFA